MDTSEEEIAIMEEMAYLEEMAEMEMMNTGRPHGGRPLSVIMEETEEEYDDEEEQDLSSEASYEQPSLPPDHPFFEQYEENELEISFIKPPGEEWPGEDDPDEYYPDEYSGQQSNYDDYHARRPSSPPPIPSLHISQMTFESPEDAYPYAEIILETLEEDLAAYAEMNNIDFDDPSTFMKGKRRRRPSEDSLSVTSLVSLPLEGEPSRLKLDYEKGDADFKSAPIPHIPKGKGVNEACEANIRRKIKRISIGIPKKEESVQVQTKQMTYLTEAKAQLIYLDMYPRSDEWKPPQTPSREESLERVLSAAEKADPQIDRSRQGPQIINFTNPKKILQPLRDDYYKDESFWTGSRFRGEYKNRQFEKGQYDHPTGVTFKSEWKDGHFHTKDHLGLLVYPRGDKFEGEWKNGRYKSGIITFADGLVYKNKNWSYCRPPDRRLRVEMKYGLKPAGNTIYNDRYPQTVVKPGCYDIGEGIYDPDKGEIRGYDGFFLR